MGSTSLQEANPSDVTMGPAVAATPKGTTAIAPGRCQDRGCFFYEGDDGPQSAQLAAPSSAVIDYDPAAHRPGPPSTSSYSRTDAVAYAKKWALGVNPEYGHFGEDCTNFISQALIAGGWKMIHGDACGDVKNQHVWWFRRDACWHLTSRNTHCSWTWSVARYFYAFLVRSGRTSSLDNIWDLELGDVLQMDFGDGHIKHTMMLTKKTDDNLYLSYHSLDKLDEPFFGPGGIKQRNPSSRYWAFRIK